MSNGSREGNHAETAEDSPADSSGRPPSHGGDFIIQVDRLEKTYQGGKFLRRGDVCALRGVSLEAKAGQVFGLLGPNGAGKTTLIKILLGVIRSTGGQASLFGLPAGSSAARKRVGYLPESLRVDRHHTARSALKFYGRLSRLDSRTIQSRSDELLQLVGLEGRDRESVKRFSKGMLQRLGLAQALMHDPDLLILDEPTDGLDPVGRSEVRRVVERLRDAGKTIFLNSHILHEVEMVCSHLAIMAKGNVLASGPIETLSGGGVHGEAGITVDLEFQLPVGAENEFNVAVDRILAPVRNDPTRNDPTRNQSAVTDDVASPTSHASSMSPWDKNGVVSCRVVCDDQTAVDAVVDRIRNERGSVVRVQPVRQTLEATFMRLVGESNA